MFSVLCKKIVLRRDLLNGDSTKILCFLEYPSLLRPISTVSLSKKPQIETSAKPDSVLALFRNHEFPNTHISKIIQKLPSLLLANADKNLKPKLEFFKSITLSGPDLAKLLSKDPSILLRNLERTIKPTITFLKTVVHTESNVITVIKRSTRILKHNPRKWLAPRVEFLKTLGVPDCNISKLLLRDAKTLMRSERFNEIVEEIKKLKFDPSKYGFVRAIQVLSSLSKSSWEAKVDIFKKWGWSEDEIRMAFRNQPGCMSLSEKKIMRAMEFLVNKMGYDPLLFPRCPIVLMYSLEKRTIPRLSVLQVLISNGLVKKDCNIVTLLEISDKDFLKKFVTKFVEEVPQLLDAYEGKKNPSLQLPIS